MPDPVHQLLASLIADLGVVSSIPAWPNTFLEIDHEIFFKVILLFLQIQEGLLSVTTKVCALGSG